MTAPLLWEPSQIESRPWKGRWQTEGLTEGFAFSLVEKVLSEAKRMRGKSCLFLRCFPLICHLRDIFPTKGKTLKPQIYKLSINLSDWNHNPSVTAWQLPFHGSLPNSKAVHEREGGRRKPVGRVLKPSHLWRRCWAKRNGWGENSLIKVLIKRIKFNFFQMEKWNLQELF